jgi:predicted TIM-barrel fold metal-dependent hydrolase
MFGSDEPFWTAERAVQTLDAAQLKADDVEMIRNGTAQVLFGLTATHPDNN